MANELRLTGQMVYTDSEGASEFLQVTGETFSVTSKIYQKAKQVIGITEEALKLGELTAIGWIFFKNLDPTNYIELLAASGGTKFAKVPPGGFCFLQLASNVTAPYAVANTAACKCEYLIVNT